MSRDPVNRALVQLGIGPAQVPKTIRNVPLTDQEYDDFSRLSGRLAKQRLDAIVGSPDWRTFSPEAQRNVVRTAIKKSRETARAALSWGDILTSPSTPKSGCGSRLLRLMRRSRTIDARCGARDAAAAGLLRADPGSHWRSTNENSTLK